MSCLPHKITKITRGGEVHLCTSPQERLFGCTPVDAVGRWKWPRQVHNDHLSMDPFLGWARRVLFGTIGQMEELEKGPSNAPYCTSMAM